MEKRGSVLLMHAFLHEHLLSTSENHISNGETGVPIVDDISIYLYDYRGIYFYLLRQSLRSG